MKRTLIVGLGSAHGDDQAGWLVIARLHELGVPVELARTAAHPADIWDWCEAETRLIICDACREAGPPGTLHRWTWPDCSLTGETTSSTHGMSLCEALELGRTLGNCPPQVEIWGIVSEAFQPGTQALPPVVQGSRQLAGVLWSGLISTLNVR